MIKTVIRFILYTLSTLIIGVSYSAIAEIQENQGKQLTIGYSLAEGSISHYRVLRLIEELKKRSGIEIELEKLPSLRSLLYADKGIIDGELSRIKTLSTDKNYSNLKIVDAPWLEATFKVIVKKDSPINITGWESLKYYRFCYKRGNILIKNMMDANNVSGYDLATPMQALKQIVNDRCDVTAYWYEHYTPEDLRYMKDNNLVAVHDLVIMEGFIYLHESKRQFIAEINRALREIKRDGTREKIFDESIRVVSAALVD